MKHFSAWALVALLALGVGPAIAGAQEIFTYTDEYGQKHFTDSYYEVPEQYRDQLRDVTQELNEASRLSQIEGLNSDGREAPAEEAAAEDPLAALQGLEGLEDFELPAGLAAAGIAGMIGAIALLFILSLVISGALLKLAHRVAGEDSPGLGKAMGLVVVQGIASGMVNGAMNMTLAIVGGEAMVMAFIGMALGVVGYFVVSAAVLRGMHLDSFGAALKVTFLNFALTVGIMVGVGVVGGIAAAVLGG